MSHLVHAVVYVLPTLTVNATALADIGRAYARRRGYEFLAVSRDWSEVEWLLATDRAQAVIFADPTHIPPASQATADTRRLTRSTRVPGHQAVVKAVGSCPIPEPSGPDRAVILVPPGQLDPHGARCAEMAERQGLTIAGIVQDLRAAIQLLHDGEASVLIVGDDAHLRSPAGPRIEIVSLQPTVSGARRSKLIRRQQ